MKPASVAALKELQEKLAFWSTWRETKQEWDSLAHKLMLAVMSERGKGQQSLFADPCKLPYWMERHRYHAERDLDYVGIVENVEQHLDKTDRPLSETEEQAWKDLMAMFQELRRVAETLQRLSSPTVAIEAKQFSTTLSEILAEIGAGTA